MKEIYTSKRVIVIFKNLYGLVDLVKDPQRPEGTIYGGHLKV